MGGGRERLGVGKKGSSSLVPRLLEASVSSSSPKILVTRLMEGVLGSTEVLIHVR